MDVTKDSTFSDMRGKRTRVTTKMTSILDSVEGAGDPAIHAAPGNGGFEVSNGGGENDWRASDGGFDDGQSSSGAEEGTAGGNGGAQNDILW